MTVHSPDGTFTERRTNLLRLDIGRSDYLSPLINFLAYEFAELHRGGCKRLTARLCKPRFEIGIGKSSSDFFVEFLDDPGWRVFGGAEANPATRLIVRHKIGHDRHLR